MEAPATSLGSTVKQAVSGAISGAAATYLDEVAKGLGQYGAANVEAAKKTTTAAVKKSGILGELGLMPTTTLVVIAVGLLVLVLVLK